MGASVYGSQIVEGLLEDIKEEIDELLTDGELRADPVEVLQVSQLIPKEYDYIEMSYTGDDVTGVIYKTGGASGTTVATLTLTYNAGVLQSVERT